MSPPSGYADRRMAVACGQCIGCRLERARQWAVRCMHELRSHDEACFLTLTYSDDALPPGGSLRKSDMTDFLKRLRHHLRPRRIRYFQCGEYGERTARPHHHMILFGWRPPDLELVKSGKHPLYSSEFLVRVWGHGHVAIGDVTFESAGYVARYTLKKVTGLGAREYYGEREPPYVTMSRRPGIGADFFHRFRGDLYPSDEVIVSRRRAGKPPKYYDRLLEAVDEAMLRDVKLRREIAAQKNLHEMLDVDRLDVKEEVKRRKLEQYNRGAI